MEESSGCRELREQVVDRFGREHPLRKLVELLERCRAHPLLCAGRQLSESRPKLA